MLKVFSKVLLIFGCILFMSNGLMAGPSELAKCLKSKGAKMYGSPKCGHCKALIAQFNGAFQRERIPFKNCKGKDKKECDRVGVGAFPMWAFSNGKKVSRPHSLREVAIAAGCSLGSTAIEDSHTESHITESGSYGTTADLAKCLAAKDVTFYGSPICGHCKHEKAWFGSDFRYIKFHNCKGTVEEQRECVKYYTYPFPTWLQKSTGKKLARPKSLDNLAEFFGCDQTSAPATDLTLPEPEPVVPAEEIKPIEDLTLPVAPTEPVRVEPVAPTLDSSYQKSLTDDQKIDIGRCLEAKNAKLFIRQTQDLSNEQIKEIGLVSNLVHVINCDSFYKPTQCQSISTFPAWRIDGRQYPQYFSLDELARVTNCSY